MARLIANSKFRRMMMASRPFPYDRSFTIHCVTEKTENDDGGPSIEREREQTSEDEAGLERPVRGGSQRRASKRLSQQFAPRHHR